MRMRILLTTHLDFRGGRAKQPNAEAGGRSKPAAPRHQYALHCTIFTAIHYNALQSTAIHWVKEEDLSQLHQDTNMHCSALQSTATHCNALQCTTMYWVKCTVMYGNNAGGRFKPAAPRHYLTPLFAELNYLHSTQCITIPDICPFFSTSTISE